MADYSWYPGNENFHPISMHAVIVSVVLLFALTETTEVSARKVIQNPIPHAEVIRAQFCTEVIESEPADNAISLDNSHSRIYYFTELRHLEGRTVFHRWEYNGRVISEVPFDVAGKRWRIFSKQVLNPAMTGKWTVWVVDQSGWPIHASIFEYRAADRLQR